MRQAVIVIDRLDAPPARRIASADAESRYPVAAHRCVQTRSAAKCRAIKSFFTRHGGSADAHGRIRTTHWVSGIDPKSLRLYSFARRHGQVSPDVTHVAVKELIAKGGHAPIVSTHRGRGQDNRDVPMFGGNRPESIVERPDALFKISVEGSFRLAARPHQYGRIFCQGAGDRIFGPLGHIAN